MQKVNKDIATGELDLNYGRHYESGYNLNAWKSSVQANSRIRRDNIKELDWHLPTFESRIRQIL
jgi:hypothetical protein